jgi:hypothetical protein
MIYTERKLNVCSHFRLVVHHEVFILSAVDGREAGGHGAEGSLSSAVMRRTATL